MQRSQFRIVKMIGAVAAVAVLVPAAAAAQSQSDTTAGAKPAPKPVQAQGKRVFRLTPSSGTADSVKAQGDTAGKQVAAPQGGVAKSEQGMVVQIQGPSGQQMTGTMEFKLEGNQLIMGQGSGKAPAGSQPKIKTEGAADTTGGKSAAAPADSAKAPSR